MERTDRTSPRDILTGTALVTGGTSGIGAEFARQLAAQGCDLVLVARNAERLGSTADALRREFRVAVETLSADLGTDGGVAAVAERLLDPGRPVDILVNNAGHGLHTSLLAEDLSDHTEAFDVMIKAVFALGNAAGRAMRGRGHGLIVNIASVASFVNMGNYSAIKAWVRTWSGSLANELHGTGVQVMTLSPGWVRTEFHNRAGIRTSNIPDALWIDVRDLVRECLADVRAGKIRSVPSWRFKVIRALAHQGPLPWADAVARRINRGRS